MGCILIGFKQQLSCWIDEWMNGEKEQKKTSYNYLLYMFQIMDNKVKELVFRPDERKKKIEHGCGKEALIWHPHKN